MKILVTGATGFVGNHVVACLVSNGFDVIATSKNETKAIDKKWYRETKYIPYDFEKNCSNLNVFEYFHKPDILINLAWNGLPHFMDLIHIEKNLFLHYGFLKNFIENGGKHIVNIGTCFEYGMKNGCLNEDMQTEPNNAYALAKDTLRKFINELEKKHSFVFQWVRLFYMYGDGQHEKSILPQLLRALNNGDANFNMSKGEQLRDYLPIEDVAMHICNIALQKEVTGIINCCKGEPVSLRKLIEDFLDKNHYSIKLNLGFYPYPVYEPMAFWGDNRKLNHINQKIKTYDHV